MKTNLFPLVAAGLLAFTLTGCAEPSVETPTSSTPVRTVANLPIPVTATAGEPFIIRHPMTPGKEYNVSQGNSEVVAFDMETKLRPGEGFAFLAVSPGVTEISVSERLEDGSNAGPGTVYKITVTE